MGSGELKLFRHEYLKDDDVVGFLDYLACVLRGDITIDYAYDHRCSQAPAHLQQSGIASTLADLFARYWWRYKDFAKNAIELEAHRAALRNAILERPSRTEACLAIKGLMDWGLSPKRSAQNVAWSQRQGEMIVDVLKRGLAALTASEFCGFRGLKLNAGYAKVYPQLNDKIVIYDGRFGAGLCWLVKRYLETTGISHVPEHLQFRWHSGEGDRRRNPSTELHRFMPLYTAGPWARCTVLASWILEQARVLSRASWCAGDGGLRKVEASIFMIGYELPSPHASARVNQTVGGQFTPLGAHSASLQLQKSWSTRQVS